MTAASTAQTMLRANSINRTPLANLRFEAAPQQREISALLNGSSSIQMIDQVT
jgi:hypothetical protein